MTCNKRNLHRRAGLFVLILGVALSGGCLSLRSNRPPAAALDAAPREGYEPLNVRLSAAASYDPDGDVLTFEWLFGDGETGAGRTVSHTFAEGVYTVRLRVLDTRDAVTEETASIVAHPVPDGFIVVRYEWTYDGAPQVWEALLPWSLYQRYRSRTRTPLVDNYDYWDYVIDPLDDPTLEDYADELWNRAGRGYERFAECALAFVQGAINYRPDPPGLEWPLYPIETMVDRAGDCEDTAILYVSLLRARGYVSLLAHVDTDDDDSPDHVLVLVPVSEAYAHELTCATGASVGLLTIGGQLYAVAETAVASGPIPLGCDPWGLSEDDVIQSWSL